MGMLMRTITLQVEVLRQTGIRATSNSPRLHDRLSVVSPALCNKAVHTTIEVSKLELISKKHVDNTRLTPIRTPTRPLNEDSSPNLHAMINDLFKSLPDTMK